MVFMQLNPVDDACAAAGCLSADGTFPCKTLAVVF